MTDIRILGASDGAALDSVAPGVFDRSVVPARAAEFLADPRHHLAVAIDAGTVVGMASAVHYIHPDKPPELWINEVGVASTHRKRGLAKRLLQAILDEGRSLRCGEAWVLTDSSNAPARRLYESVGGSEPQGETVMYEFSLGALDDDSTTLGEGGDPE